MIKTLTSLRAILAIMIFLSHSFMIDDLFSGFLLKNGYVAVTFFFILSGFVISYNYQRRIEKNEISYSGFIYPRISKLYPLHLFTLVIMIAINFGYILNYERDILKFIINLFLLQSYVPLSEYYFSYNSVSWCLSTEMFFYICFPFIAGCFNKSKNICITVLLLFILVPVLMYFTPSEYLKSIWYINPFVRIADFILGIMLYNLYTRVKTINISRLKATLFEVMAVFLFAAVYLFYANPDYVVYGYSVLFWLPALSIILIFSLEKGLISRILRTDFLVKAGNYSLCFYMSHMLVIVFYKKIIKRLSIESNCYIDISLIFIISCISAILIYLYFEKPVTGYLKQYFQKRAAYNAV